jgi:hypothetical protein
MSKQNIRDIVCQAERQGARVVESGGKHPTKIYPPKGERPIVIGKNHRGDDKAYCNLIIRELKRAGIVIAGCALLFAVISKYFV